MTCFWAEPSYFSSATAMQRYVVSAYLILGFDCLKIKKSLHLYSNQCKIHGRSHLQTHCFSGCFVQIIRKIGPWPKNPYPELPGTQYYATEPFPVCTWLPTAHVVLDHKYCTTDIVAVDKCVRALMNVLNKSLSKPRYSKEPRKKIGVKLMHKYISSYFSETLRSPNKHKLPQHGDQTLSFYLRSHGGGNPSYCMLPHPRHEISGQSSDIISPQERIVVPARDVFDSRLSQKM